MAVDLGIVRALVECRPRGQCLDETCPDTITDPGQLPMDWRIDFEERAAILEYDGGLSRAAADAQALREILKRRADAGTQGSLRDGPSWNEEPGAGE